jgi:hypothetical protein
MRGLHPLWALVGLVLCVIVAVMVAPVFPTPIDTLLYWGGWIGALVFLVLGILWIAAPSSRRL